MLHERGACVLCWHSHHVRGVAADDGGDGSASRVIMQWAERVAWTIVLLLLLDGVHVYYSALLEDVRCDGLLEADGHVVIVDERDAVVVVVEEGTGAWFRALDDEAGEFREDARVLLACGRGEWQRSHLLVVHQSQ